MLNYQNWLNSQSQQTTQRMIAVKLNPLFNGNSVFRYYSTHALRDTTGNITYSALITNQFTITENIDPYSNTAREIFFKIRLI